MLRRVAFADLPRDPQQVRVLHHSCCNVVIAAVAYKPTHPTTNTTNAAHHRAPLFFTVAEMAAPNERSLPLRVVHVRVPAPYNAVNSLTLVRSSDGAEVYVVVQAAELPEQRASAAPPTSVATFVYRRQVAQLPADGRDDADDDEGDKDGYAAAAAAAASLHTSNAAEGGSRVRYQRLPRPVAGGDAALWSAATGFSTAETPIFGAIAQATEALNAGGPAVALLTASCGAPSGESDVVSANTPSLQLWTLTGTRVALAATCSFPALAGFPISEIRTVAGTQNVALLRCHNSVLEVDLAALRGACVHFPHTVRTNAFLTRAWRLSPHAKLTACAVKDAMLYAATEEGCVVVWDLRQPTSFAAAAAVAEKSAASQPRVSPSTKSPITGLYAPYATGFITCDAGGAVRDWRERADMAEEDEDAAAAQGTLHPQHHHRNTSSSGDARAMNEEAVVEHGVLRDVAELAANAATAASAAQFPYCTRAAAGFAGAEGCVAMDGHDNFAAVVGEGGRLSLYFCT